MRQPSVDVALVDGTNHTNIFPLYKSSQFPPQSCHNTSQILLRVLDPVLAQPETWHAPWHAPWQCA